MTRMDMGVVYFMLVKERNCESIGAIRIFNWMVIDKHKDSRSSFIVCRTDELSLNLGVLFMYSVLI